MKPESEEEKCECCGEREAESTLSDDDIRFFSGVKWGEKYPKVEIKICRKCPYVYTYSEVNKLIWKKARGKNAMRMRTQKREP